MSSGRRTVLVWNGPIADEATRLGAVRGLRRAADHLLEVARREMPAPLSTELSASGRADVDTGALKAAVSFDTVYAVKQHEDLDYEHPRGGGPKYLERPARSEKPVLAELVAAAIRAELAG